MEVFKGSMASGWMYLSSKSSLMVCLEDELIAIKFNIFDVELFGCNVIVMKMWHVACIRVLGYIF